MNNRLKHNGEFVTVNQHKIHIYRQGNINNPKLIFQTRIIHRGNKTTTTFVEKKWNISMNLRIR